MNPPVSESPDDIARVIQTLARSSVEDHEVESLVHAASQPMLILDADAHVLTANARAEALLERETKDMRGRPFTALVPVRHRANVRARLEAALATRQAPADLDAAVQTRDGEALRATLTFLPFTASRDARVALLVRETSETATVAALKRELAESEARRTANEESIERNRKLTDLGGLASGMAHEIKTPATYIENLAHLSESQATRAMSAHPEAAADIEPLRANAALIKQGAQRIRQLLHELQPLTRNRPMRRRPVDLATLVADAVRTFQGSAKDARTEVLLDLQATHPVELDMDEMSRVLLNLLKNASEAMKGEGHVTIRTRNQDCPPQIRVEDEGPGIPEGLRLFEPFQTTKKEGTGLGLAISKRIVEAHGGTLRHEKNAKGGATFVIEFPAHRGSGEKP